MNLSDGERRELMAMQRSRAMAVGQVRRARLILLLDEGASRQAIVDELRCDSRFITTWKTLFASERLAGLSGRHLGRAPRRDLARAWKPVCLITRSDVSRRTARPTGAVASSPRSWACRS